jgi:hypothetical protein
MQKPEWLPAGGNSNLISPRQYMSGQHDGNN